MTTDNQFPTPGSDSFTDVPGRLARAEAWLAQDPDPETRAELSALLGRVRTGDVAASADLADRFDTRLAFGTAGRRGGLGAGPNRMNRVLVAQAAAGLAAYLVEQAALSGRATSSTAPSVVIGYDGRKNSDVFAHDSAEIMAGAGVDVTLLPRLLPTPVLAFSVRHLGTSAGVMVTASHNPPLDNGYKVYLGGQDNGAQIISPSDMQIAAHIAHIAETMTVAQLPRGQYATAEESVIEAYIRAAVRVVSNGEISSKPGLSVAPPTIVYTAMHGVGWETLSAVWRAAGFEQPAVVPEQVEPDAAFPTVVFPNPEEAGAMDLAFARAREVGADLIIANDPDADRFAVAIPDDTEPAGFRRLSGNDVGLMLGWRAARAAADAAGESGAGGTLACSIVSSPGLERIAHQYGLEFRATLTGFKWISRTPGLIFGFEEALGYLVNPDTVTDKDGISASLAFTALATELGAAGKTVADHLDELTARFGAFASTQISLRVSELARIGEIMTRLRDAPPDAVAGIRVQQIDDFSQGFGGLPPTDMLRIVLESNARIMVRPSGTEPKLKAYIDASEETGTVAQRRSAATALVATLAAGLSALLG